MRHRRTSAFTLLEVLLVVVLVGILAAIVWPDFTGAWRAEQLDESVRRVKALVAMARAEAMNQGCAYRLTFERDGTIAVTRQLDPIAAPHVFGRIRESWAGQDVLLEGVWVSSLAALPQGPQPLDVTDDQIEFNKDVIELMPIGSLEEPMHIDFAPDGASASARWVVRDENGRGVQMTLDGRLGRVFFEPAPAAESGELKRPAKIEKSARELEREQAVEQAAMKEARR